MDVKNDVLYSMDVKNDMLYRKVSVMDGLM